MSLVEFFVLSLRYHPGISLPQEVKDKKQGIFLHPQTPSSLHASATVAAPHGPGSGVLESVRKVP